jgi:hypothetical protein
MAYVLIVRESPDAMERPEYVRENWSDVLVLLEDMRAGLESGELVSVTLETDQ